MKREKQPTRPLRAREMLAAIRNIPAAAPDELPVFVQGVGWQRLAVLPRTKVRVVGEGMLVHEFSPDTTRAERTKLWEQFSERVHDEIRRGNEALLRELMPEYPSDARRLHSSAGTLGQTSTADEPVRSVSGVELAKPTAREISETGRKGGFRASSRRFGR
jgi:hypothetical protein